ncbi:MAG: hypothetical protein HY400_01225 [Elusimicrobia bacterium]|nr:hypothetical protein [Elusimicrobiota bacterium]
MNRIKTPTAMHTWSNKPGAVYPIHAHSYLKTLFCVTGSIQFKIHKGTASRNVMMKAGDKIELPPKTSHSAIVGPRGVTCIETHQY